MTRILAKMATLTKRVTPWRNQKEWRSVYKKLFSSGEDDRKHGLRCLCVWKSRAAEQLPVGIESTWQLINAKQFDEMIYREGSGQENEQQLTMMYSMAVIRFVNLITDISQKKLFAQPIHMVAEELGLPHWIVSIRHEASHSHVPSLTTLREAADFALNWLKCEYWEAQAVADTELDSNDTERPTTPTVSRPAREEVLQDVHKAVDTYKTMRDKMGRKTIRDTFGKISSSRENSEEFASILCSKGYLLPSQYQLNAGKYVKRTELMQGLIQSQFDMWTAAIDRLNTRAHFMPSLLNRLGNMLTSEGNMMDEFITECITVLVQGNCGKGPYRLKNCRRLNLKPVTSLCIERPNKRTPQFLLSISDVLLEEGVYNKDQLEKLISLTNLYTQAQQPSSSNSETTQVFDVAALQKLMHNGNDAKFTKATPDSPQSEDTQQMELSQDNSWYLAPDDMDWSRIPIGSFPGVTTDDLELPEDVDHVHLPCDPAGSLERNEDVNNYSTKRLTNPVHTGKRLL